MVIETKRTELEPHFGRTKQN